MRCFEILIAMSAVRKNGGPAVPDNFRLFALPQQAKDLLEPVLGPYDRDPNWFFDNLQFGPTANPWAIACLDREYALAGHVAASREPDAGILFSPYTQVPSPVPQNFVPGVGVLVFMSREGLKACASRSALFKAAWDGLQSCGPNRTWLALFDPLDAQWLAEVQTDDRELWLNCNRV